MWLIFSLLSALGAALVTLFAKLKLNNVDTLFMVCLHFFIMFLGVLFICILQNRISLSTVKSINNQEWLFIIINGLIASLAYASYFLALKYGPASKVFAVDKLNIVLVLILSIILLQESHGIKAFIGAALMILGSILIAK